MSSDPYSLPFWLGVPVALLLLLIPGLVTHSLILTFGKSKLSAASNGSALSLTERIFWTLALSVTVTSWTAFVLAEIGLYSTGLLLGIMTVYSLVAGFVWFRRENITKAEILSFKYKFQLNLKNLDGAALAVLLLLTVGLFCWRTHETIVGGQDSGTYYDSGINIAQTGSIMVHDPLLTTFTSNGPYTAGKDIGKLQSQLLQGMPGESDRFLFVSLQRLQSYFVNDNERGLQTNEVVPQFFHFYPTLIAVAYSLFGFFGGLYVTPLLGVLAVFAVYLTGRRLFPAPRQRWIAWLGALLLALNPAQVWFVRETLWETLGQFLIFTGIYAAILYARPYSLASGESENPDLRDNGAARLGAFGAGVGFGLVTLAHSQFPFIIAPLFPLFVYLRLSRRWSREVWWLALPFGVLLLHTTIHIRAFALGYFEGIYHHILQFFGDTIVYWTALLTLLVVALIIIDAMPQRLLAVEKWVLARWKWVSLGVAVIVVGYLLYSYFVRVYQIKLDWHESEPTKYFSWQSYIGAPTTAGKERNLLRLGWYLSPLGIGLVFVGMAGICWKRLNARSAMFLSVTAILSLVFLDQNYTLEHFIYSLRRYVPVTFPAFSIVMAYALLEVLPYLGSWLFDRVSSFGTRRQRQLVTSNGTTAMMAMPGLAFSVIETAQPDPPLQTQVNTNAIVTTRTRNWGFRVGRWSGYLGALALSVFFVFTGMTIYRLQQYDGVTHQLENLAQKFGPRDIVIFSGEPAADSKIAVPLNYVFDRQSFVLTRAPKNDMLGQVFSYWQKQGYHIKAMLGDNGGRFSPDGFDLIPAGNFKLTLTQLQDSDKQKPKNIETNSLDYGIYDVQSHAGPVGTVGYGTTQANSWTLHVGNDDYPGLIDGFYPVEREPKTDPSNPQNAIYRWTDGDAQHHPILRLPCLTPNVKNQLSLTLSPGLNPHPITLKVYLSNQWYDDPTDPKSPLKQPAGTIQLTPGTGPKTYTVDVPSNLPQTDCANGSLILHLVMTDPKAAFVPLNLGQGINDARLLGYKFYQVALSKQP